MKKTEMIEAMTQRSGLSRKECAVAYNAFCSVLSETLAGGEAVGLPGLGTFQVRHIDTRMGRNPRTGQEIIIPAHKSVAFRAAVGLKAAVNQG